MLKHEFGMHPLTVTWAPHIYTDWGWRNHRAWIHAGFDNYLCTPNGKVHRLVTRLAVENLFIHFNLSFLGQKALAPKMAAIFKIPLVFYGENEAEYGNPIHDSEKAERDWSYFTAADETGIYLGGTSLADLKGRYGLDPSDLKPICLPAQRVKGSGSRSSLPWVLLKWHPQEHIITPWSMEDSKLRQRELRDI